MGDTPSESAVSQPLPQKADDEPSSAPVEAPGHVSDSSADSTSTGSQAEGDDSLRRSEAIKSGPLTASLRGAGPLAARGLGVAKPASPTVSAEKLAAEQQKRAKKPQVRPSKPRPQAEQPQREQSAAAPIRRPASVPVPNRREQLPADIQAELDAELAATDIESLLSGPVGMVERTEPLGDGARVQGQVLKIHDDSVFIALGGPDEGVVPLEQFTSSEPVPGQNVEVIVRGVNNEDGLYILTLPGQAVEVTDWEDLEEGSVIEVTVTGHNAGGLECKAGGVKGFIPISQVTEYRIEDLSEFVEQKLLCVVTEANMRRGNLVLSRRAILERDREEKRKEQLEKINAGDELEGVVRSIKDFGAFVDLGGLDGLIHISKMSWDRVKHPSEVLEVGQKVKVKIDKIDKETGKIGLSYRDLLENPWDSAESSFGIGSVHKGTVSRIANFGCFVRLAAGVEGLVHISELAHHRVSKVDSVVSEGEEVEVKVLSFDRDSQKIGLSLKAVQAAPAVSEGDAEAEEEEPQREPAVRATHSGPLKGGTNKEAGGGRFGLRW